MCQPGQTKDELIELAAENVAAVIVETRPRPDELRQLLETEMRKLVDAFAALSAPQAGGGGSSGFG
jgi:hypothetical protein